VSEQSASKSVRMPLLTDAADASAPDDRCSDECCVADSTAATADRDARWLRRALAADVFLPFQWRDLGAIPRLSAGPMPRTAATPRPRLFCVTTTLIVAVRARRGVVRTRDGAGIAASGLKLRQPRDPLYKRMVGR
jgi:hypothetical protein